MSDEYALIHAFLTQGMFYGAVTLTGGIALFGLVTRTMKSILNEK